jgi:amino acid adenylation domain-containing protein
MPLSPAFVEFPRSALAGSLPDRFDEIARRHPDRLALADGEDTLTYAALARAANQIARALLGARPAGPEPVALLVDHGVPAIAAILGVLKAGKFCAVLDTAHPEARLAAVLQDLEAHVILHGSRHAARARGLLGGGRQALEIAWSDGDEGDTARRPEIDAHALAYVCYTAGTTGTPKGVLADHRGVIHRAMTFVNSLGVGPDDRLTLLHGLGVGASFRQLWGGLLSGAVVCPFDLRREGTGPVAAWLRDGAITRAHFPASAFRHFAGALDPGARFPAVRSLTVSNEPVFPGDLAHFRRHFPGDAVFAVMLGINEAGNVAQYLVGPDTRVPDDAMPIGHPLPDKEILLLGDDGQPLGGEAVGEIAVRSDFLAPGYWRRPELDRAAFLPDPEGGSQRVYRTGDLGRRRPDGAFVHLGRRDAVPKLRGRFIDPLEIERRLLAHPDVSEAAIAVREDRPGDQRLVAYVVSTRQPAPSAPELRRFAAAALPEHMVPSVFVSLPALPRTANGKVDRRGLPSPSSRRPALGQPPLAPRSALETRLATIWCAALGLDEVGVEDDFLDLGGHSLLASTITAQVRDALGVELSVPALLASPTVARMATAVIEAMLAAMPPAAREEVLGEPGPSGSGG